MIRVGQFYFEVDFLVDFITFSVLLAQIMLIYLNPDWEA